MKRKKFYLNMIVLILLAELYSCQGRAPYNSPVFPLQNGNYWDFSGKYNQKTINFRIEVRNVVRKKSLTFALMRGFPTDVMTGDDWEASSWGLLIAGSEHYYRISGPRMDTVMKKMNTDGIALTEMVTDADLFLETLYDTGQTFGEAAQLTRDDGNYYWRVIGKSAFDPSAIKGLQLTGLFDQYTLSYRTQPDETLMDIVPGIGITRYRYIHHGTSEELDLRLTSLNIRGK
jgi:hypothetical protein